MTTCQRRYEESFTFPSLGRFVPRCEKDGGFQKMQCLPSTSHCWCVNSYGVELLGTRQTRGRPNCTMSGKERHFALLNFEFSVLDSLNCELQSPFRVTPVIPITVHLKISIFPSGLESYVTSFFFFSSLKKAILLLLFFFLSERTFWAEITACDA